MAHLDSRGHGSAPARMAGWRVGFAVGCAEIVERINSLIDHATAGVFTALQRGLEAALRSDRSDVQARREISRAPRPPRRDAARGRR